MIHKLRFCFFILYNIGRKQTGILPEFYATIVFDFSSFDKDTQKKAGVYLLFMCFFLYFQRPSLRSIHASTSTGSLPV